MNFLLTVIRRLVSPTRDAHWPAGAYVAEFGDEHHFSGALAMLRDEGYTKIETYTPYSVPQTYAALPVLPSLLPLLVFLLALGGGAISYWSQWYTNAVSYPLNIGGRPAHAAPAFFIPTFEGTVLVAAVMTFVGLLFFLRLPRPWHPIFEADGIESASIDHYWVAIDASDHRADDGLTPRALEQLRPLRVVRVRGD